MNSGYMKAYRRRYPEYVKRESEQRKARTEALRRLRDLYRVEYEQLLIDVLRENETEKLDE